MHVQRRPTLRPKGFGLRAGVDCILGITLLAAALLGAALAVAILLRHVAARRQTA
jgi:hypothetical protein